jgi:hypothetical protein
MHTTKVDPDLVDITRYNVFQVELFWGLERLGAAQSGPRDNKEGQRAHQKANSAANQETNQKANYKANRGGKAKTPNDVQEAHKAQGELGSDNEPDEAEKAQEDIGGYADKDGISGDDEDDIRIQTIATGDLAAMKILAKNRSVCGIMAARLARVP